MKTTKEWFIKYCSSEHYGVQDLVEEVQKEAYNEALDDASKLTEEQFKKGKFGYLDKKLIQKLKKL